MSASAAASALRHHAQPFGLGLGPALAAGIQPDAHIDAAVLQVQRMGMALAAIAEDRNLLALEVAQVCLVLVVDFCHEPAVPLVSSLTKLVVGIDRIVRFADDCVRQRYRPGSKSLMLHTPFLRIVSRYGASHAKHTSAPRLPAVRSSSYTPPVRKRSVSTSLPLARARQTAVPRRVRRSVIPRTIATRPVRTISTMPKLLQQVDQRVDPIFRSRRSARSCCPASRRRSRRGRCRPTA